jgi:hypothetical protein
LCAAQVAPLAAAACRGAGTATAGRPEVLTRGSAGPSGKWPDRSGAGCYRPHGLASRAARQ